MKNKIDLYLVIEITKEETFQSFKKIYILVKEYMNNEHKENNSGDVLNKLNDKDYISDGSKNQNSKLF